MASTSPEMTLLTELMIKLTDDGTLSTHAAGKVIDNACSRLGLKIDAEVYAPLRNAIQRIPETETAIY